MGRIQINNFLNNNFIFLNLIVLIIFNNYTIINNYMYSLIAQYADFLKGYSFIDLCFFYNNISILKIITIIYILAYIFFAFTSKLQYLKRYTSYLKIIILNKCYNIYSELLSSDKKYISLNKIFNNYNFKNIFFITILFLYIISLIQYKEIIENKELILFNNLLNFENITNIDNYSIVCNILISFFYTLIILHIIVALYSIFFDYCTKYMNYTFTLTLMLIILILYLSLAYYLLKNNHNFLYFCRNTFFSCENILLKISSLDFLYYTELNGSNSTGLDPTLKLKFYN